MKVLEQYLPIKHLDVGESPRKEVKMVSTSQLPIKLVILIVGFLMGCLIALWAYSYWAGQNPLVEAENGSQSVLKVGDNYGEQKTAPINVLEPKVSDAYYQWAPNVVQNTRTVEGQRDLLQ